MLLDVRRIRKHACSPSFSFVFPETKMKYYDWTRKKVTAKIIWISSLVSYIICYAVAGGFPELLAPRGGTHSEAEAVALARFPGALYLWSGGGHSRNWAAGEIDIFADQEKRTQTLSRVNGGE